MAASPVIASLPGPDRARVLGRAVARRLEAGEILVVAGDPARRIYSVESGILKHTASDRGGRETIVAVAVPGDLVGEAAALDDVPHPFHCSAMTPAGVLGVASEILIEALARNPRAALTLARLTAGRARHLGLAAHELARATVPARVAGRLLDLAALLPDPGAELPIDQADLARLAGTSRESVCRALKWMKDRGIVDYRRRGLRVLRPDLLHIIRCGGTEDAIAHRAGWEATAREPTPLRTAAGP